MLRLTFRMFVIVGALTLAACGSSHSSPTPANGSKTPCAIPQNNGGDHDSDNNGGPNDDDGCR